MSREGGEIMGRENFKFSDEASKMLTELSDAMGMSKNALLEKLLSDEYERQSELLSVYRELLTIRSKFPAVYDDSIKYNRDKLLKE